MMAVTVSSALFVLIAVFLCQSKYVLARESSWSMKITQDDGSVFKVFPNYMYKGSSVSISVVCNAVNQQVPLEISWVLQRVDCIRELYTANMNSTGRLLDALGRNRFEIIPTNSTELDAKANRSADTVIATTFFQAALYTQFSCDKQNIILLPESSNSPYYEGLFYNAEPWAKFRLIDREKQDDEGKDRYRIARIWEDGMYHLLLKIRSTSSGQNFSAEVNVQMKGLHGLLSAVEYPLLPVAGVMSVLYLCAGTVWIFLWAKAQEHTLKIHVVIGAVAVAGALGNTLLFSDMFVRNTDGIGIYGIYWVGDILSSSQINLALLVIMIVSTGYGINRPTLSHSYLQAMVVLTAVNFASKLALLVVSDETLKIKYKFPGVFTIVSAIFLLSMLAVTTWIMVFAINTFVYLYERRHSSESKLKVFCLFMACCISVFISHFIMGVVLFSDEGWFKDCRQNWKQEWIATSFNQLLVFILLSVMMWLWRPMDELSSYGFQPLSTTEPPADDSPDEKEKIMLEEL